MPSVILFVGCERVAFDQANGSAILIGVFQGFKVTRITKGEGPKEIPPGALPVEDFTNLPIRWSAFALLKKVPEDEGKNYEQRVELVSPRGEILVKSNPLQFSMTHTFHRLTTHFSGLPANQSGEYTIKFFLGESGKELTERASYPLDVTFSEPESEGSEA